MSGSNVKDDRSRFIGKTMQQAQVIFVNALAEHPKIQQVLLHGYRLRYWCLQHRVLDVEPVIRSKELTYSYITDGTEPGSEIAHCLRECMNKVNLTNSTEELANLETIVCQLDQASVVVIPGKEINQYNV